MRESSQSAHGGVQQVYLVGMMGAGKTTVGRMVASRMGWKYLDTDEEVERSTGQSVARIFESSGEAHFRSEESAVLRKAVLRDDPTVVAVAGGAVLDPQNRSLLQRARQGGAHVVWLRAQPHTLAARVGSGSGRPLLAGSPQGALAHLEMERRPYYEELAGCVVDVDDLEASAVADLVIGKLSRTAAFGRRAITVELGQSSYLVHVGRGALSVLGAICRGKAERAAVVTQQSLVDAGVLDGLDCAMETKVFLVQEGEQAKSLSSVEQLCRGFATWGLTRRDIVVAVGGGVVTDLGGFAASCYHRGIGLVNVATTLLAQVDAAIGGKTGVNLPEGKNLVGAFWQPSAVICDTGLLASLPARERLSGMGEMVKYAFLGAGDLRSFPLDEQVARCVEVKASVVSADEREAHNRMVLNYGHTLGHALEALSFLPEPGWDLRHGEAVAIGIVFAARLAERLGRIGPERVEYHRGLVADFGLPVEIPAGASAELLIEFMARDKKNLSGLTFVLDGPSGVEPVAGVDPVLVKQLLADLGCEP